MITKNHKKSLSPDQELAIASLMSGATDQEAAKAAGVSRETANRWRNHDPFFQAELNRRQQEIWESHKRIISVNIESGKNIKCVGIDKIVYVLIVIVSG